MKHGRAILLILICAAGNHTAVSQDAVPADAAASAAESSGIVKTDQARIDGPAELTADVGMRAAIAQVFFPGTELQPVDDGGTADRDVVIRIDAVYPHGDGFRYDLTWTGFRPGRHDLGKSLRRKDGSSAADLPALPVTVTSVLPPDRLTLSPTTPAGGPWVGGYQSIMSLLAVLWVLGLAVILWTQKQQRRQISTASANPAEQRLLQLRQMLTKAASGELDAAGRTAMEALIFTFFREQRGLPEQSPQQLQAALQQDPVAGPLLRQLERWLYDRPGAVTAAVDQLLVPLQQLTEQAAGPTSAAESGS